ncbi:MAG: hypothetical protein V1489_00235 [Candidatus Liptonbacteria bacterium]
MKPLYALRTRFGKHEEIVAEFLPPSRLYKEIFKKHSNRRAGDKEAAVFEKAKVMIMLSGVPAMPSRGQVMDFFSKKGYWVFYPRYRGTWESSGKFLARSPHEDVIAVIDKLPRGFKDSWSVEQYKIKPEKIDIVASSFGGPAGIIASCDPRINKIILISPVVDWRADSKVEPLPLLYKLIKSGFGEAYRIDKKGWHKLMRGKFYNPAIITDKIDGKKLFFVHAKDDDLALVGPVIRFAKKVGAELLLLPRGGHLSSRAILIPKIYRRVHKFLSAR